MIALRQNTAICLLELALAASHAFNMLPYVMRVTVILWDRSD